MPAEGKGNSKSWGSGCSHEWYCVVPDNQKRQEMCLLIQKVGLTGPALDYQPLMARDGSSLPFPGAQHLAA